MSRYVVLEFKDNTQADNFVAAFDGGRVHYGVPDSENGSDIYRVDTVDPTGAKAVGLFMRPNLPCECSTSSMNRQKGYAEGQKYGIWVHAACGKPNMIALEWWGHHPNLGNNLLVTDQKGYKGLIRLDGSKPPLRIFPTEGVWMPGTKA